MGQRVQVILSAEEKARLVRRARHQGMSLSAWIRQAALERLAEEQQPAIEDVADLRRFFEACDRRESGTEPDWDEHREVIARSKARGASDNR